MESQRRARKYVPGSEKTAGSRVKPCRSPALSLRQGKADGQPDGTQRKERKRAWHT